MKSKVLQPIETPMVVLRPEELSESADTAVRDLLAEATAANTERSYKTALRYWAAWHQLRYGTDLELPLQAAQVIQFVVDHFPVRSRSGDQKGELTIQLPLVLDEQLVAGGFRKKTGRMSIATITHRVAVLSKIHQLRGKTNPCELPAVRQIMKSARRSASKRQERPTKKTAMTKGILEKMLGACGDDLTGKRDRALLLFAFASGGRRRSEVADALMKDLHEGENGNYVYRLEHSKTNQEGSKAGDHPDKPVMGRAGKAMKDWLDAAGIVDGFIFRRIRGNRQSKGKGVVCRAGLSGEAVALIIKQRAAAAGVAGDFGGHSARSGFMTESGRQGVSLADAMALSGHRTAQTAIGYMQVGELESNPAAKLMDESE